MKRVIGIVALILTTASGARADRSISIAVPDGKLQLINGSTATVSYSVECYDKTTGSNILTGASNLTMAAKASATYQTAGSCASGSPVKTLSQGPFVCSGSQPYANAVNACGADSSVCTIQKMQSLSVNYADFGGLTYYWLSTGASTAWSITYDGSTWNDQTLTGGKKNYGPVLGKSSFSCSSGSGGAGSTYLGCSYASVSNPTSGTVCCPNNNGFVSCKVTIFTPATSTAGHLQSPQFKGGSPF